MEKWTEFKTDDGHVIYGTWNGGEQKSSRLIIFVHGLTGNQNEHHYFNAVPFFTKKGFDTFRFDFYSGEEKARQLSDCSIKTHVNDLRVVIDQFKDQYQEVLLVGHSIGATVILSSDLAPISKIVLWDPSKGMDSLEEKEAVYISEIDKYVLEWGVEPLVSQEMVDDWKAAADIERQVSKIAKPCKFIFAGEERNYKAWEPYIGLAKVPCEHIVIDGASHVFDEEGKERQLFEETFKWLK